MNRIVRLLSFAFLAVCSTALAADKRVQDFVLDDHTVYSVPVSGTRVTTISFPSPIAAIDGALLTSDGKIPALFQIAHTKGTSYFSLRALTQQAATNLNVRWNNRTYAFELHESGEPLYSIVLRTGAENIRPLTKPLTPPRLLGLLDKVKAFPLLQAKAPDEVANIEHRDLHDAPLVSDCGDYVVKLTDAFRFPEQDTLVFHLIIENRSDSALQYSPERLQVRVADRVFTPSLTDLTSTIAPHESTLGYVLVSGSPGDPNDLSLKNDFTFVLARQEQVPATELDAKDIEPAPLPQ